MSTSDVVDTTGTDMAVVGRSLGRMVGRCRLAPIIRRLSLLAVALKSGLFSRRQALAILRSQLVTHMPHRAALGLGPNLLGVLARVHAVLFQIVVLKRGVFLDRRSLRGPRLWRRQ